MHTLLEPGEKGFLLADIGHLIAKVFEDRASQLGLSRHHWHMLAHLSHNPGLTQAALAHLMEVEPITLSRHLDRMERDHLIERRNDPGDRRVKRVYLTEKAMPQLSNINKIRDEIIQAMFMDIPPEKESMFMDILTSIRSNLRKEMPQLP